MTVEAKFMYNFCVIISIINVMKIRYVCFCLFSYLPHFDQVNVIYSAFVDIFDLLLYMAAKMSSIN